VPRTTTHTATSTTIPELLTVEETARYLSLSRSQVYALIARGVIPIVRIEGSTRVSRRSLLAWIEALTTMAPRPGKG
jgi:excisionase family DNA binding protein